MLQLDNSRSRGFYGEIYKHVNQVTCMAEASSIKSWKWRQGWQPTTNTPSLTMWMCNLPHHIQKLPKPFTSSILREVGMGLVGPRLFVCLDPRHPRGTGVRWWLSSVELSCQETPECVYMSVLLCLHSQFYFSLLKQHYSLCYPFSGLHGNMATPSLLHTSSNSHSVERQRRLYWACKKSNKKLYWAAGS